MTTVSYELSKKLHEKYPAMGSESYWVWLWEDDVESYLKPRNNFVAFPETQLCPALTLGELVRWLHKANMRYHLESLVIGEKRGKKTGRFFDKHTAAVHIASEILPNEYKLEIHDSPENALAQAIIEGGM